MSDKIKKCTVYIDEAGDLGIQRGTRWFVMTGVIVMEEDEKIIRAALNNAKNKFNVREIHLRKLNDFYKTSYVVSQIRDLPFTTINILMDTNICPLKDSIATYNYMCRFLLERASWYMRDNNLRGDVVLSSRGTSRDKELISYIKSKLLNYDYNQIAAVFTDIKSKQAASWDMLQLADICATSMFKSYEINHLGFVTPCHMMALKDKVYTYNGKMDKYGLKFYSDDMKPNSDYFKGHYICKK